MLQKSYQIVPKLQQRKPRLDLFKNNLGKPSMTDCTAKRSPQIFYFLLRVSIFSCIIKKLNKKGLQMILSVLERKTLDRREKVQLKTFKLVSLPFLDFFPDA